MNEREPMLIELSDIRKAQEIIADYVHKTPITSSKALGIKTGVNLYFKAEVFQKTGSFKPRGALNKLHSLTDEEKKRGVITVSSGNHAQGLAYASSLLGISATVVMPEATPQNKVNATRGYGAEVILHGRVEDLMAKCLEVQKERNLTMVHPFDDPLIIAGQGTIGLEILEDFPEVEWVFVPVGGGGLISGISTAIKLKKADVKIIGVEPTGAAAMLQSVQQNAIVRLDKVDTIAEGLGAPFVGEYTLAHVKRYVDDLVLVSDKEIVQALRLILERCKILTEPAGAAGFAALLFNKVEVPSGAQVVCVLSGGNIDLKHLKNLL